MEPRTYKFNKSTLTVKFGNIIETQAEVIVSSDDCYVTMGGGRAGVSGANTKGNAKPKGRGTTKVWHNYSTIILGNCKYKIKTKKWLAKPYF